MSQSAGVAVRSAVVACLLGIGLAQAAPKGAAYAIQPLGTFHKGEAIARDGEPWLVLWTRADGRASRLGDARVRLTHVQDALLDGEGEASGEEISVPVPADGRETPLMFLRGGRLKPGTVVAGEIEDRSTDGLPAYTVRFAGREARVETRCASRPAPAGEDNGDIEFAQCRIEWVADGVRQTVIEMPASRSAGSAIGPWILGNDATPRLLFAGDLDRDGHLDAIIDTSDHYNLSRPTLFLSSAAGRGAHLRRVSEHRAIGC